MKNPKYRHKFRKLRIRYQKLRNQDSDYAIPALGTREAYEDTKMVKNLVAYAELDQSKREAEESQRSAYQTLVKTSIGCW